MNLSYFNIKNSVKDVMEILQQKAIAKNIELEYDFESLSISTVYHDKKRI